MKYKSVNELEKFSFEDCVITNFEIRQELIYLELEALIVKPNNSQNTNYTESYAGYTELRLTDGKILSGIKEGFKYYNADDVLVKEIPDEPLTTEQIEQLIKKCSGAYLFAMRQTTADNNICADNNLIYEMGIEFADEENTMADSYLLTVSFEKAIVEWDEYMNRVQR